MNLAFRILKVLALVIIGCLSGVFLPVVPVDSKSLADPVDHFDSRISAVVTDADLKQILSIVRHGRCNNIYEILLYHTRSPLTVLRSTIVRMQSVLSPGLCPITVSISQCPIRRRSSTEAGRSP